MNKGPQKKSLTDWDWETLVAAWRYYNHRTRGSSVVRN